jgi:hypothetical protein
MAQLTVKHTLSRLEDLIERITLVIGSIGVTVFSASVIYTVALRFLFNRTPHWAEEVPRLRFHSQAVASNSRDSAADRTQRTRKSRALTYRRSLHNWLHGDRRLDRMGSNVSHVDFVVDGSADSCSVELPRFALMCRPVLHCRADCSTETLIS